MTKQELEDRVAELEEANNRLTLDLESAQKQLEAMAKAEKPTKRGTQQPKAKVERDAFGQRLDSFGHRLNEPIIALIEKGRYEQINPETLSRMTGGAVSSSRYRGHLTWLKRKNLL